MSLKSVLQWSAFLLAIVVPLVIAASSPLLAWRNPVYIAAGLCGVIAMSMLLAQPLLAGGYLPGLQKRRGLRFHRLLGIALLGSVACHVGGLWITSPPDVIDALLFRSPTPFSLWGVIAMWAVLAAASLALLRPRLKLSRRVWSLWHIALAMTVVVSSIIHAWLIEGTMGTLSKTTLSLLIFAATVSVIHDLRKRFAWRPRT